MADYEFWLTNDTGKRIELLTELAFATYTRSTLGLGTLNFGMPFGNFSKKLNPFFLPDWRVEVWRAPAHGYVLRREDVFMLRKPNLYTRDDGMQMIQFYGRNGIDLLQRRSVIQRANTSPTTKSDYADDMMKDIVREQMLYGSVLDEDGIVDNTRGWPQNEFFVHGDVSLGPTHTANFSDRPVIDVLKEIQAATFQKNSTDANSRKIYFDVVPVDVGSFSTASNAVLGWQFRTYAGLYGSDRTMGIEFSLENENLGNPVYSLDHLDEITAVWVKGNGQGSSQIIARVEDTVRVNSSRWNLVEKVVSAAQETNTTGLQDAGYVELNHGLPKEELTAIILNTPGSETTPRSLYGIDWDLGDLIRVNYANKQFNAEITIVYVSVDDQGREQITGRNTVQ